MHDRQVRGRRLRRALVAVALASLLIAGGAYAVTIELGNMVVSATAEFQPRKLPAHGKAPASFGAILRIKTRDHTQPPALSVLTFIFDKHGSIDTRGVPTCTLAKLEDATPTEARQRCAGALVGKGTGKAEVTLPGQKPVTISSPISIFNAPPQGGKPSMIAHAYERIPKPQALLVPFTIARIHHGRYGFEAKLHLPPIAEGFGAPLLAEATVGRTYKRGGKAVGYTNAECSGGRLQVHGTLTFADGSYFQSTLTSPCHTHD
jgi:hypothetical protein